MEARWLPARRSPGDVAPPGGTPRGVGRHQSGDRVRLGGHRAGWRRALPRRAGSGWKGATTPSCSSWSGATSFATVGSSSSRCTAPTTSPTPFAAFAPSARATPGRAARSSRARFEGTSLGGRCQPSVCARHRAPVRRRLGGHSAKRHRPRCLAGRSPRGARGRRGCAGRSDTDVETFWPRLRNRVKHVRRSPSRTGRSRRAVSRLRHAGCKGVGTSASILRPMAQVVARGPVSGSPTTSTQAQAVPRRPLLDRRRQEVRDGDHRADRRRLRRRPHDRQSQDVLRPGGDRSLRRVAARAARAGASRGP